MTTLRRFVAVLGGLAGVSAVGAVVVVGCSSEEANVVAGDAAPDRTAFDAPVDQGVPGEGGVRDGGIDVSVDAPDPGSFATQVLDALCARTQACCTSIDAGMPFDMTECHRQFRNAGGAWGELQEVSLVDGGKVTYNSAKAAQCISAIALLDCAAVTGANIINARGDCIGALVGTVGPGADCHGAIECQPGNFCNLPLDGGVGGCAPVRGDGGACGDFGRQDPAYEAQYACSYRGGGETGLTCVVADVEAGTFLPPSQWVCAPMFDGGALCYANLDCRDGICNNDNTCGGSVPLVDQGICDQYRIADAGGGG
jgi:hypothetical protein